MQHEEHSTPAGKSFGTNTNGFGILIVTIVAVFLTLFCWNFWKSGSKEAEHYRLNTMSVAPAEGHHGHEEHAGEEVKTATSPEHAESAEKTEASSETSHEADSPAAHSSESADH